VRTEITKVATEGELAPVEYAVAVDRYLDQACLSAGSRRVYRISLAGWAWALVDRPAPVGAQRRGAPPPVVPLALLDSPGAAGRLAGALALRSRQADPRTVNRELSALRSAVGWWLDLGWIGQDPTAGLRHHGLGAAVAPALSPAQAAAVFALPASLREQAFWRLLHDSGSAAEHVLALDATAVDLTGAPARAAGPALTWTPGTAQLLAWLLAGRRDGPLFLTDRRAPARAPAADVCPVTRRARMSYRRAAEIFATLTRPLDPAGRGWTLHQLRQPAR
jgi:hypothetical protein